MDKPEKGQADNLEEQDASMILEDPELAKLALLLRQTLPPIVDPAYQEALQAKLLETVRAHRPEKGRDEGEDVGTAPEASSSANTPGADTKKSTNEPDTDALEDDTELATLAYCLQQTAPTVPIDPGFQEALQEKLLEAVRRPPRAASEKGPWGALALKSGRPR